MFVQQTIVAEQVAPEERRLVERVDGHQVLDVDVLVGFSCRRFCPRSVTPASSAPCTTAAHSQYAFHTIGNLTKGCLLASHLAVTVTEVLVLRPLLGD